MLNEFIMCSLRLKENRFTISDHVIFSSTVLAPVGVNLPEMHLAFKSLINGFIKHFLR